MTMTAREIVAAAMSMDPVERTAFGGRHALAIKDCSKKQTRF